MMEFVGMVVIYLLTIIAAVWLLLNIVDKFTDALLTDVDFVFKTALVARGVVWVFLLVCLIYGVISL